MEKRKSSKQSSITTPNNSKQNKDGQQLKAHPENVKWKSLVGRLKSISRSRKRTEKLNLAFNELKQRLPNNEGNPKLTKLRTLRLAIDYIYSLEKILDQQHPLQMAPCNEKVENTELTSCSLVHYLHPSSDKIMINSNYQLSSEPVDHLHVDTLEKLNHSLSNDGLDNSRTDRFNETAEYSNMEQSQNRIHPSFGILDDKRELPSIKVLCNETIDHEDMEQLHHNKYALFMDVSHAMGCTYPEIL